MRFARDSPCAAQDFKEPGQRVQHDRFDLHIALTRHRDVAHALLAGFFGRGRELIATCGNGTEFVGAIGI
ncbi:hypothetical protein D3C83_151440 [compost metagenome]